MPTTEPTVTPLAAAVADLGITMHATFIPWSRSRNRNEKRHTLEWMLVLEKPGAPSLRCEYSQGVGYIPGNMNVRRNANQRAYEQEVCESGKYRPQGPDGWMTKPLPAPSLADVLESLVSDAGSVLNARSFEEWATDLGYDPDSRTAEATYRACLEIARDLRNLLGSATLDHLLTLER